MVKKRFLRETKGQSPLSADSDRISFNGRRGRVTARFSSGPRSPPARSWATATCEPAQRGNGRSNDVAIRIMIVEDQILIATDLEATLMDLGFDVVSVVSTGEEAVRVAELIKPDVVLMDVHLAGKMDGIEAACRIHERFSTAVILVTASSCMDTKKRAKSADPVACLSKNCSVEELDQAIQGAIKRSYRDDRNP
jgi:CheY-like chemotaxis protein